MHVPPADPSPYPCLAAAGVDSVRASLERLTYGRLSQSPTVEEVAAAFRSLYDSTWSELSMIMGAKGVQAVMARALKQGYGKQPALRLVEAGSNGLLLDKLVAQAEQQDDPTLVRSCLTTLYFEAMEIICSLVGSNLLEHILRRTELLCEGRG